MSCHLYTVSNLAKGQNWVRGVAVKYKKGKGMIMTGFKRMVKIGGME